MFLDVPSGFLEVAVSSMRSATGACAEHHNRVRWPMDYPSIRRGVRLRMQGPAWDRSLCAGDEKRYSSS